MANTVYTGHSEKQKRQKLRWMALGMLTSANSLVVFVLHRIRKYPEWQGIYKELAEANVCLDHALYLLRRKP